jgi:hypothetical protein
MIRHSRRRAGGSTGWRVHPLSTGGTTSCWMFGKALLHPCPPPSLSTSGPRRVRRRVHEGARTDAPVVGLERRGEVPRVRFLTPHRQRRFATGGRCSRTVSGPMARPRPVATPLRPKATASASLPIASADDPNYAAGGLGTAHRDTLEDHTSSLATRMLSKVPVSYGVKERCVWIAHVEDHDPQRLGAAAVVARHFHLGRFHHRLTGLHRDGLPPLNLQGEGALQDVHGHRETMRMEHGFVARLDARCERVPPAARSWACHARRVANGGVRNVAMPVRGMPLVCSQQCGDPP